MGGIGSVFGSSSNTKKENITNVTNVATTTTSTTNKVGDIGITGRQAVDLTKALGKTGENMLRIQTSAGVQLMDANAKALSDIASTNVIQQREASNYAQALATGAAETSQQYLTTAKQQGAQLLQAAEKSVAAAENQATGLISAAGSIGQSENKNLVPYIMLGMVGVIFAMKGLK